jgi:hypothetical protein
MTLMYSTAWLFLAQASRAAKVWGHEFLPKMVTFAVMAVSHGDVAGWPGPWMKNAGAERG